MKKHDRYSCLQKKFITNMGFGTFFAITAFVSFVNPANIFAQSLPNEFAEQQIPSSFAVDDDVKKQQQTAANAAPVADKDAADIKDAKTPPEPKEEKLVPATAMGVGAKTETKTQKETLDLDLGPSVKAPTAASSDMPSADILEQYEPDVTVKDDALPQIDDSMMLGLDDPLIGPDSPALMMDAGVVEEKTPEELQEEIKSEAFDAAITGLFPLDESQISRLLKKYDSVQEATATPPYDAPTPEISVQNLSLDPGVPPAVIKTAIGNVTTLNILDVTGSPWPVQDVTWAGDFEVIEPEEGGHIIRITPMSHFAKGNMVIRMLTLKTPIIVTLDTSRDVVQYRVDARISEYGPFAKASLVRGGKSLVAGSPEQTSILDGAMPAGMTKLNVSGVDGRTTAYTDGASTYVRTPLTLLSPAWQSSISSADGMNVYVLSSAPVLLLSDGGDFQRATLTEKEDLLDE